MEGVSCVSARVSWGGCGRRAMGEAILLLRCSAAQSCVRRPAALLTAHPPPTLVPIPLQDEARAKRYQDEHELAERRKVEAEAAKRAAMQKDLEASRVEQLAAKAAARAEAERQEAEEFQRIMAIKRAKEAVEHEEVGGWGDGSMGWRLLGTRAAMLRACLLAASHSATGDCPTGGAAAAPAAPAGADGRSALGTHCRAQGAGGGGAPHPGGTGGGAGAAGGGEAAEAEGAGGVGGGM